jgi:predicted MFS family arabinose efflux permease
MSSSETQPRIVLWFVATASIFFTRALLFSTWLSRGPEVQQALSLNTAQMGLFVMLFPLGGLAGVFFARAITARFGAKLTGAGIFVLGAAGMVVLGFTLMEGNLLMSALALFAMGLPMAVADFLGNFEGTEVDRHSERSLFPAIHAAFGMGMLLGAGGASLAIDAGWSLIENYLLVATIVAVGSVWASLQFPPRDKPIPGPRAEERQQSVRVWKEKRALVIGIIGFSFVMAEISAGTWVPIALTASGFSAAAAAFAYGVFWIAITIGRLLGGFVVDKIGRYRTVLLSTLMTASGIVVFMLVEVVAIPFVGLVLWGLGMSMGLPMAVAAMSDDPKKAPHRINMIITVGYISSITVGPGLGSVGEAAGIYVAFSIPLALMILSAFLSPVTKPLDPPDSAQPVRE